MTPCINIYDTYGKNIVFFHRDDFKVLTPDFSKTKRIENVDKIDFEAPILLSISQYLNYPLDSEIAGNFKANEIYIQNKESKATFQKDHINIIQNLKDHMDTMYLGIYERVYNDFCGKRYKPFS